MTEQYDALQFPFRTAKMALARLVILSDIPEAMEMSFQIVFDREHAEQCLNDTIDEMGAFID